MRRFRAVATGPLPRAEPAARFRDSSAPGREAAFSRDGRRLVTSADEGVVTPWRLRLGTG